MEKLAVSVEEAAELASVGVPTIRQWCANGLPYTTTKGGGKWIIPVPELREWIEREAHANAAPRG